ncbi:aspartyl-phosphate phosphatase Spo0E family protein [Metabacillus sp. GX 13764]|uniref:aspartyl-phosphate phosphatase Spo0E family protein n=1 Tax=Metabacillus kandeliae TaxID=2900151 RepID=UPI001E5E53B1|nr:aspartyl-phosphate phosphatase Spo0E family protein [Metabacillus kandeliae]MCD7036202.1 aspartyl-phosphate phosphatase Spo0E family protein [Metabacillus kandeliae]
MNLLEIVIEKYRSRMVDVADKYGFTARETVEVSQYLDRLLNIKMDLQTAGTAESNHSHYASVFSKEADLY